MMPQYGEGRNKNQRNMYVIGAYKKQLLDLLRLNNDFQQALLHKEFPKPNQYEINKIRKYKMSHINKMLFDLKLNECKKNFFLLQKKFGIILTKLMNKKKYRK